MGRSEEWSTVLRATRRPVSDAERDALLVRAVALGVDVAPEVVGCSLTVEAGAGWQTPYSSDRVALILDGAQYGARSGPCVEAAATGSIQQLDAIATDGRFRGFADAAAAHGVLSSLSVPLPGAPRRSALNLYASAPRAFDTRREREVAQLLAQAIAALLGAAEPAATGPETDLELAVGRGATVREAVRVHAARTGRSTGDAYRQLAERTGREGRSMGAVAAQILADDVPTDGGSADDPTAVVPS